VPSRHGLAFIVRTGIATYLYLYFEDKL